MYNSFETLQLKYKKYLLKKIVKTLVSVLVVFLMMICVVVYFYKIENIDIYKFIKNKTIEVEKIETKVPQKLKIIKKEVVEPKLEKVKVKEIEVHNVKVKKKRIIKDVKYSLILDANNQKKYQHKRVKKYSKSKSIKLKKETLIHVKESKPISISVKELKTTAKMIKFYNKEKKYSLALKIAKLFYKNKDYAKSLLWSKKANSLDHNAEGAWIMYVKSEYKRGNKKQAIKILKLYSSNSNSKEAALLLSSWLKGKQK